MHRLTEWFNAAVPFTNGVVFAVFALWGGLFFAICILTNEVDRLRRKIDRKYEVDRKDEPTQRERDRFLG
jgi:hypothetical protein